MAREQDKTVLSRVQHLLLLSVARPYQIFVNSILKHIQTVCISTISKSLSIHILHFVYIVVSNLHFIFILLVLL